MCTCLCVHLWFVCVCVERVLNQRGKFNHDVVVMIKNSENEDGKRKKREATHVAHHQEGVSLLV